MSNNTQDLDLMFQILSRFSHGGKMQDIAIALDCAFIIGKCRNDKLLSEEEMLHHVMMLESKFRKLKIMTKITKHNLINA